MNGWCAPAHFVVGTPPAALVTRQPSLSVASKRSEFELGMYGIRTALIWWRFPCEYLGAETYWDLVSACFLSLCLPYVRQTCYPLNTSHHRTCRSYPYSVLYTHHEKIESVGETRPSDTKATALTCRTYFEKNVGVRGCMYGTGLTNVCFRR